ncbi:MAG: hypothetical protein AAGG69_05430 [Pseudomonadota bacterium]
MAKQPEPKDNSGTIRLAGATAILVACVFGMLFEPFGSPLTSAGILGGIAAISFAMRGLFVRKPK